MGTLTTFSEEQLESIRYALDAKDIALEYIKEGRFNSSYKAILTKQNSYQKENIKLTIFEKLPSIPINTSHKRLDTILTIMEHGSDNIPSL